MSSDSELNDKLEKLDWLEFQSMSNAHTETFWERGKRKSKENPFVPIGLVATTCALSLGLYHFYQGNAWMSQYMMRARVAAQAFTVTSMAVGYYILSKRDPEEPTAAQHK